MECGPCEYSISAIRSLDKGVGVFRITKSEPTQQGLDDRSMSDRKKLELSRRKVLGGLGTIGIASAGAGLGTSAYFSDEETFKNNTLTAGSLDLKVDWEEHYSDWSDDEMVMLQTDNGEMKGVKMELESSDDESNWHPFPDTENPLLYVHVDAIDEFMAATALEAYPDDGNNGTQSLHRYSESEYCEILADTPEDLEPSEEPAPRQNPSRTRNSDTVDEEGNPKPLISLEDVKPGDFGELTLSYHLCDNPGYVWLTGDLISASENGLTEPEAADPDEEEGVVELLDAVQTMLWYDEDGDNVYEPGGEAGEKVDVVLVLDRSGSMGGTKNDEMRAAAKDLVDALNLGPDAAQVGIVSFADQEHLDHELSTNASSIKSAIDGVGADGSTNLEGGVNGGEEELRGSESGTDFSGDITPSGNDRSDAEKIMVVLSDGSPNVDDDGGGADYSSDGDSDPVDEASRAKGNGIEMYTIGFGVSSGSSTADTLEDMASSSDNAFLGDEGTLEQIFGQISQQIAGEKAFFRGTLRELLDTLGHGSNGIPLDGDRSSLFDEVPGDGMYDSAPSDPASAARDCFVPATLNQVGFAWWLPIDHANEIQTDSVSFDLGFYTEQCRHNEGAGMGELTPTRSGSGFAKLSEETNQSAGYGSDGENFNGDETISGGARARFGNNGSSGSWELGAGNELGVSGEFNQANYVWDSGETVDWMVNYDEATDELTFEFDGTSVPTFTLSDQPDGRIAIQGKANQATVEGSIETLYIDGEERELSGENTVVASNDGDGRDIQYLVLNTDLDGETSFTIQGTATVTLETDYGDSEEGVAFDVVLE